MSFVLFSCGSDDSSPVEEGNVVLYGSGSATGFMPLLGQSALNFGVDPSNVTLRIYQVAVALNADCSNPIVIFRSTGGRVANFITNPVLGSGNLADGSYNCIMMTMSDTITYSPSVNDGTYCVAGTSYTADICRAGTYTDLMEGTTSTYTQCLGTNSTSGGVDNKVTVYVRTGAPGNGELAFRVTHGIQLLAPFVVSGRKNGTFYVDAAGSIQSNESVQYCENLPSPLGFR
jgi:hypothetical protein